VTDYRIWLLGVASMLIYMVRNGIANWGVTFLSETRTTSLSHAGFISSSFEWMGIPGTLLAGFVADRFFPARNLAVAGIYLVCLAFAVLGTWFVPQALPAHCLRLRAMRFLCLRGTDGLHRTRPLEPGAAAAAASAVA